MPTPPTKLTTLKNYMAVGDHHAALALAKSFPQLGKHKEAITRGWEALVRPRSYEEMGQDPAAHVNAGLAAIRERYRLDNETQ